MTQRYRYTPLQDDTRYFRLLKLLPGRWPAELRCELEPFHIKEHGKPASYPDYGAISYVWGVEEYRPTIRCHSWQVEIPTNLKNALYRLRSMDKPEYLWTDSICINQTNEFEKNGQIQVMGSIYRDARIVYVWLGEEKERAAFSLMDYLGNRLSLHDEEFQKRADNGSPAQWQSLSKVLKLNWFERVWTLQEICLAAHATVLCGPSRIDWPRFLALCKRISTTCRYLRLKYDLWFYQVLRTDIDFKNGREGPGFILKRLRTKKCTNDIDRVRGIMGHAFFRRFRHENGRDFIPLTNLTSENLDFAISTELLKRPEPLYTLSLVQHDAETIATYAHPSWVPRFRQNTFISTLADETKCSGSWNASGRNTVGSLTPIRNVLQVVGVEVDCIEWQSPKITNKLRNRDEDHIVKDIWQQILKAASSSPVRGYQTREEMEKTCLRDLCRVLHLDNHFVGREGVPDPYPSVDKQMADCLAYFADNEIELPSSLRHLRQNLEGTNIRGKAKEFFLEVLHHCRNRCFIITSRGYLGLAPELSHRGRDGDKVCVLFGGQVPFLLRPGSERIDEYRLGGECFLLDLMHGKAMELGAKQKTFTLV